MLQLPLSLCVAQAAAKAAQSALEASESELSDSYGAHTQLAREMT